MTNTPNLLGLDNNLAAQRKTVVEPLMGKIDVTLTENGVPNLNFGDGIGFYHC